VGAIVDGMGAEPRTPEELDALLEDAFVLRDAATVSALFEPGAVLVAGREVRGAERIAQAVTAMWQHDRTYLARPRRVVQAHDTALFVADQGISVMRRRAEGDWRFAIALLDLDQDTGREKHHE
jgi:hypothetical protein